MRDPRSLLDVRHRHPEEQKRWETVLRYFIRLLTVQQENAKQAKAMVLKSPTHGFRLPLLPSMFPLARYVVIERNPYEVFASNLRLWLTLLDMYSVESVSPEEVENFILKAYVLHEEAIAEGSRLTDAKRIARVRYEDLVADPVGEMARLYDDLELEDFDSVRSPLERYLTSVAGHTRNRLRLTANQKERVTTSWGEIIRSKGYSWPDDHLIVA